MINLLPEKFKKELIVDYCLRVSVVLGIILSFVLFIGLVMMIAFYFVLLIRSDSLDNFLAGSGGDYANLVNMERQLSLDSKRVDLIIASDDGYFRPSVVMEDILSVITTGISVSNIRVESVGRNELQITINGLASTRTELIVLVDNLRSKPNVISVESPVSNLIRETDSVFSIKILANK